MAIRAEHPADLTSSFGQGFFLCETAIYRFSVCFFCISWSNPSCSMKNLSCFEIWKCLVQPCSWMSAGRFQGKLRAVKKTDHIWNGSGSVSLSLLICSNTLSKQVISSGKIRAFEWGCVCVCVCYLWYVVYISYPNFANQPHLPSSSCQGQEESQPVAGSCRQEEMCSWHVFWSWNCGQVKWVILSCGLECILNTIPIPK